jgi:hypothetical protein
VKNVMQMSHSLPPHGRELYADLPPTIPLFSAPGED